ncbi:hypothetical protein F2Q68_00005328 [Brassica cretica]|uniref:Uncharacterized protein n=1 Tax=Brassica cretica TaxID=69181 RepID=A0A8S9JN91_BRACR|nr:hypothetical protein F2Q68_00005328 [Brassica cretica]
MRISSFWQVHGDLSFGVTLIVLKCNHFQLRDLNPREQFFEDVTRHACDDWDLKYSEMDSLLLSLTTSSLPRMVSVAASVVGSLSDGILFSIIFHGAVGIISYHSNTTSLVLYQIYKGAWNYAYNKVRNLSYGDMMGLGREELDLITEDTQQKHTTSSHFTSLHPQLHHHRSSFTDNFTDLKADHKTKERRERSLPALILRAPQLVTYSTGEPRNPHNSRLIKDLTHG